MRFLLAASVAALSFLSWVTATTTTATTTSSTMMISKVGSIPLSKTISPTNPGFAGFNQYFYTVQENGTVFAVDSTKMKIMYTEKFPGLEFGDDLIAFGKFLVVSGSSLIGFSETGEFLWDESGFGLASHYTRLSEDQKSVYFHGENVPGGPEPGSVYKVDLETGKISAAFPVPSDSTTNYEYSGGKTIVFTNERETTHRPFRYEDKWTALFDFLAPNASPSNPVWNISGVSGSYRGEDSNYIYLEEHNYIQNIINFTIYDKKTLKLYKSYNDFSSIGGGQELGNARVLPRSSANGTLISLLDGGEVARLSLLNTESGFIEKQYYLNQGNGVKLSGSTLMGNNDRTISFFNYDSVSLICEYTVFNTTSRGFQGSFQTQFLEGGTDLVVVDKQQEVLIISSSDCSVVDSFARPLPKDLVNVDGTKTHIDQANRRFMFTVGDAVEIYSF